VQLLCAAGNCWITGSIPNSMRSMTNLLQINLSNNWLNGTLPSWLDEFQQVGHSSPDSRQHVLAASGSQAAYHTSLSLK
jgi:hypothetical protein